MYQKDGTVFRVFFLPCCCIPSFLGWRGLPLCGNVSLFCVYFGISSSEQVDQIVLYLFVRPSPHLRVLIFPNLGMFVVTTLFLPNNLYLLCTKTRHMSVSRPLCFRTWPMYMVVIGTNYENTTPPLISQWPRTTDQPRHT